MTREERKNKTIAALTTTGVNLLLLLLLFFAGGWGFSGEGLGDGEYPGIEVNLGYDDEGTGTIEPMTEVGDPKATDDEDPPTQPIEEKTEPVISQPEPAEESSVTKTPETEMFTDPKSDVELKEVKKENKPVEKTTNNKPEEKVDKPVEKKPEEKKPEEKKPVEKPKAVYQGKKTTNSENGTGDGKQGTPGNQGDDIGREGNKGVPGGTEGAAVYKGKPGGGGDGGFGGLDLYGWEWDFIPKPNIPDNETGRIVFEIEVNENGELERYRKESSTVSAAAERACIAAIQKLTFTKKTGAKVPPLSKGKITFVIRAK
jgi:protein TonB